MHGKGTSQSPSQSAETDIATTRPKRPKGRFGEKSFPTKKKIFDSEISKIHVVTSRLRERGDFEKVLSKTLVREKTKC